MSDQFTSPAGSSDFKIGDALGSLVLVKPTEFIESLTTTHGDTSAVDADIVILDGDNAGEEVKGARLFGKVIVNQTKRSIGGMVLGRVGQGQKKPGKNAPWQLSDPTEADKVVAREYLAKNAATPF